MWDERSARAVPFDTPGAQLALEGSWPVPQAVTQGPDGEIGHFSDIQGRTGLSMTVDAMRGYSPEWAQGVCDVPAATIRRVALEYLEHACIGQTIEIDGQTLPHRCWPRWWARWRCPAARWAPRCG